MGYVETALDFLECQAGWRYGMATAPATEPTAWAALRSRPMDVLRRPLVRENGYWPAQNANGSVGIRRANDARLADAVGRAGLDLDQRTHANELRFR